MPVKKVGEIFKASPLLRPRPVSGPAASSLATIAEVGPIVIDDDDDTKTTGAASGSAEVTQKAPPPVLYKRRPMLKSPPTTRPKAVLKSAPVALTRAPPPVEKYVVIKGAAVVPVFDISDFAMKLPGLPSSIASSPAITLAPETPRVPLPAASSQPRTMAPPPVASPKPKAPSREQVQIEVDTIMREVDEKRAKRTKDQQQLHDAMLSAIFKAVFEDTVPDSAVGIYSSGEKDRMGCEIPKVIDFRSLPVGVQDDLMRAEILPTMWPRYRISGYERMFHYCLMTVIRRRMLFAASCHTLTPAGIDNMYPPSIDEKHRAWIMDKMFTPCGPQDAVD